MNGDRLCDRATLTVIQGENSYKLRVVAGGKRNQAYMSTTTDPCSYRWVFRK
jgi:hypothetical protein